MLDSFAGMTRGSFFAAPSTDVSRPAHESYVDFDPKWWAPYVNGRLLLFTPNLVWLVIAGICFVAFPYGRQVSHSLVVERAALNCALVLLFFGFWHVTLYLLHWGKRPFKPNRVYRIAKVAHNVFYSLAGALLWTGMEMALLFCYQTGCIVPAPHTVLNVLLWSYLGIVIRDIHFYFAHRFIHIRFLYAFVHSLHHRNVDIEPFSGLCMHTAEHLMYFSCALIPALLGAPAFASYWVGIHALLSPAASHSGFEDNWQSDLYHYIHHASFDSNYGVVNIPWDRWFGTVRNKLPKAEFSSQDTKASLGVPSLNGALYVLSCLAVYAVVAANAGTGSSPLLTASLLAFGSTVSAAALHWSAKPPSDSIRKHYLFPFHRESLLLVFHGLVAGLIIFAPLFVFGLILTA